MQDMTVTLGVDIGTTSAKVVAFAATGSALASTTRPITTLLPTPDAAEQDPRAVAAATLAAIAAVADLCQQQGYTIARLGISAAMHSLIVLDATDQPLTNALIWLDNRASAVAEALWQSPQGPAIYARTGTPIHAMAPLAKILWLRTAQPDLYARAHRFVSLKEWLWHSWFGDWQIDASIASATGLYNLRTGTWDAEALAVAGITPDHLSAIVPTTYARPLPAATLLPGSASTADVTCAIGASDGVLANLAAGVLDHSQMVLTIGTSCAVRTGSPQPLTASATRSFCYVLDRDHFIIGGPSNSGGAVLEWAHHTLTGQGDDLTNDLAAAEQAGDPDLLCLPYLAGERAPLWDARATGTLHGLRLSHTPAHLLRAVVEGIIFNAYWIAEDLFALTGRPQQVVVSGKVLHTPWIAQLVADSFNLPVTLDHASDASAMGAAKLALVAAQHITWDTPWGNAETPHTFIPQATLAYATKYRRFRHLSEALAHAL